MEKSKGNLVCLTRVPDFDATSSVLGYFPASLDWGGKGPVHFSIIAT